MEKTYRVPVEWTVYDYVEVDAKSFRDAVAYVVENKDEIPLGTEPEYIDGTYKINGEDDIDCDLDDEKYIDELTEYLEAYEYGKGY